MKSAQHAGRDLGACVAGCVAGSGAQDDKKIDSRRLAFYTRIVASGIRGAQFGGSQFEAWQAAYDGF